MLEEIEKEYFRNYIEHDGYISYNINSEFFLTHRTGINEIFWDDVFEYVAEMISDFDRKWIFFNTLGVIEKLPIQYLDLLLKQVVNLHSNVSLISPIMYSITRIFTFEIVEVYLNDLYNNCKTAIGKSAINAVFAENRPPLDLNWTEEGILEPLEVYKYKWTGKYYKIDMLMFDKTLHKDIVTNIEQLLKKRYYTLGLSLLHFNYSEEYKRYLLSLLPINKNLYYTDSSVVEESLINEILSYKQ